MRKKTAARFAGFVTRLAPEDNLMGEGAPDELGVSLADLGSGTLQLLGPGEDIKFSAPADVGSSYAEFMRQQFRAVAAAIGITYEMLTGEVCRPRLPRPGLQSRHRCARSEHAGFFQSFAPGRDGGASISFRRR